MKPRREMPPQTKPTAASEGIGLRLAINETRPTVFKPKPNSGINPHRTASPPNVALTSASRDAAAVRIALRIKLCLSLLRSIGPGESDHYKGGQNQQLLPARAV